MAKTKKVVKKTAKKSKVEDDSLEIGGSDDMPSPEDFEVETKKPVVAKPVKARPNLSEIMAGIKSFGAEVMAEEKDEDFGFPYRIPFNHVGLQMATGGLIGGKFCEISGDSQTGKSYLIYELVANVQKMNGYALLYDLERAFEPAYAKASGIDLTSGTFAVDTNPDIGDFFNNSMKFIAGVRDYEKKHRVKREDWAPILICCDSFPGLNTKVDLANMKDGKDLRGYAAMQKNAYFSQQIDKFIQAIDTNDATFVLINQTRINNAIEFGDKTVTLAENVIKFWATQRIRGKLSKKLVRKIPSLEYKDKGTKETVGSTVVWETIKNRSVKPFQKVMVRFRYATGLEKYSGIDEILYSRGKITQATTSLDKNGEKIPGKPVKGFKVNGDPTFFYNMEELVNAHPELIVPAWTGTYDDGEQVEENDEE